MDWTAPIDIYCERLGPDFWAEPINAITNLGFLIAAAYGFATQRRAGRIDPAVTTLIALVAAIGIGSFLFHTFANRWSALADVIPITLFIYIYLGLALRRFFGLSWLAAVALLLAFFVFNLLAERLLAPLISGSAAYVPALLAMLVCGGVLTAWRHPAGRYLLMAGGVFLVSLTVRTLDLPLCDAAPLGIHWAWHLLNAVTLAVLLKAAVASPMRGTKAD